MVGARLRGGEVIALSGTLGVGKTSFVKGVGEALKINPKSILSPTFILRAEHEGRLPLAHVDLYRLDSPGEIQSLGLLEQENRLTVLVIEWPEKALSQLPPERLQIEFFPEGESKRRIIMSVFGNQYLYLLKAQEM